MMGARIALAALALFATGSGALATAPIYDPVSLNIGINCQWQQSCERRHRKAMREAARFIAAKNPPLWRIHMCNRNARRGAARVDWVGFNECVRNTKLLPPDARRHR